MRKIVIRFQRVVPKKIKDKTGTRDVALAEGIMSYYDGEAHSIKTAKVNSGGWGRGSLPPGKYIGRDYTRLSGKSYIDPDGYGWGIWLDPQFECTRTGLMIHFDGGIKGTLGCVGLTDKEENKEMGELLRKYFLDKSEIPVEIVYMPNSNPKGIEIIY